MARGRPRKITARDFLDVRATIALDVLVRVLRNPARGAQADAIRDVAKARKLSFSYVEKALQRRRFVETLARYRVAMENVSRMFDPFADFRAEWKCRTAGLPEDVKEILLNMDASKILPLLRQHGVNGSPKPRFEAAVRRGDFLSAK